MKETPLSERDDWQKLRDTLGKVAQSIDDMMRPILNSMQSFQDAMKPFMEMSGEIRKRTDGLIKSFSNAMRPMLAAGKLGEAQFVYWAFMSPEFIDEVLASPNVNKTLRAMIERDRFQCVNHTIDQCLDNPLLIRHSSLFFQSVIAFQNGQRDLAVLGFVAVLDGLLSAISGDQTTKIAARVKVILGLLEQNETVNSEEYALLTLMLTFQKTMDSFSAHSDFSRREPKELNRHWIAHGRSTRAKTKLDCVKLIHMIYGTLLIDRFGRMVENA